MDFIERIFSVSPDGGSGALEALLFLVPLLGVGLLQYARSGLSKRDR
jgi:hypothetical protein